MGEIPIRQAFFTRNDAEAARDRLEYGGFGRSRVQLMRIGDQFIVVLYAYDEEERQHAQHLVDNTGWLPEWANRYGRSVAEHAPTPGQTLLGLAALAGAGAALYWAFKGQQGRSLPTRNQPRRHGAHPDMGFDKNRREPARDRPTAADLYRATSGDEQLRRAAGATETGGTRTTEGSGATGTGARTNNGTGSGRIGENMGTGAGGPSLP